MEKNTMLPSEKTFIDWAERNGLKLSSEEATLLLGYISGHGYGVTLVERDLIALVDTEEPENGIIARGIEELLERVIAWNYEFLQDSEVVGSQREEHIADMEKIARMIDRLDLLLGMPMGVPTVKELIGILSKLPEDYRVYCCGGENYMYLWDKSNSITIDHEYFLG